MTTCFCHVTYASQSEFTLYSFLTVKELLAGNRTEIWSLSNCNGTRTHNLFVLERSLNQSDKLVKGLRCVVSAYLYGGFGCMFLLSHVRVSDWIHTLHPHIDSCLNVKEPLVQNICEIWSLSDCKVTETHSHLVRKRTLKNLTKLENRLSSVVSSYLYGAFDCMFWSCHVRVSEWIHTLQLPKYPEIFCPKLQPNMKFKWVQWHSKRQQLSS